MVPSPNHPRPFYEHTWPADLPESCQICGTKFRFTFNLSFGPGRARRFFRSAAYYSVLPCIAIGLVSVWLFPGFFEGFQKQNGFWVFFTIMFFPPLILISLSALMPKSRHVVCKKCGWNRDFKPLPLSKKDANSTQF